MPFIIANGVLQSTLQTKLWRHLIILVTSIIFEDMPMNNWEIWDKPRRITVKERSTAATKRLLLCNPLKPERRGNDHCIDSPLLPSCRTNKYFLLVRQDKLIKRFRDLPRDFTFEEMTALFKQCGFELGNKGVSPEIHSAIAMLARRAGMSINAFIRQVLAKEVDR